MTKLEHTIANLKKNAVPEPQQTPQPCSYIESPSIRKRLALALMRADRQVSCLNCKCRYRPCSAYKMCKEGGNFAHFEPKDSLMEMQMRRVDELMKEINQII